MPSDDAMPAVIVIGNLTIDDVVRPDGTTTMATLGGNAIHTSTAARIWGVPVAVISRVGEDFPPTALARLREAGIETGAVRPIAGPTLRAWVLYEEDGRRSWVDRTPAGRSAEVAPTPEDLGLELWEGSGPIIHIAAMPLPAAARLVEKIRHVLPDAMLTLDTHEDWSSDRAALLAVARLVDVFLPSREQLQDMLGYDNPMRACTELLTSGVRAVVAKCGADGVLVAMGDDPPTAVPATAVSVVDPTGAGDCFCGGLAAGLALGDNLLEAARRGVATAGAAISATGSLRLLDGGEARAKRLLAAFHEGTSSSSETTSPPDEYDIAVMRREIGMIPALIRTILEDAPSRSERMLSVLQRDGVRNVVFVGCGDSTFVGHAASLAFNRHTRLSARSEHALDFARYTVRYQEEGTVVVAVSFSGKVGRTIEAAHQARAFGLPVVALTHDPESPLAEAADQVSLVDVPTLGFSPGTSTYIGMLTTLLSLPAQLEGEGRDGEKRHRYIKQLGSLPELARETIEITDGPSLEAAKRLLGARIVTYIGAGPNEASARFGAAKLFEGAQQLASATNLEEWAHVQYFTTRPGDPVVLVAPDGAATDRAKEILSELAYVGATTVLVSDLRLPGADIYLPLARAVGEELSPVLAAIPLSLLGFHLVPLNNKRSYNFPSEEARREHYDTIHCATVGEPA